MCSFSHLNMCAVRMSDLRSVQFDVRDRNGECVSIASDISINIRLSCIGAVLFAFEVVVGRMIHFVYTSFYTSFKIQN